jgi:2-polyprenyl-6-methoxyphenol hydroxylase-like FAD-dependent oxidoreductase
MTQGTWRFLASVAPADVLAGVFASESLDDVVTHAFPASRRRRYEHLKRLPCGLVAVGDAISSFNPVYGQGMSVAALQAVVLQQALASGKDRLSQRYFKASVKIVDIAWDLAIGSDPSLPRWQANDRSSPGCRRHGLNAYSVQPNMTLTLRKCSGASPISSLHLRC